MDKSELRLHYKKLRKDLGVFDTMTATNNLADQLMKCLPPDSSYIHVFLPIKKLNEIDTFSIRNKIDILFPDVRWVVAKTNFETGELQHYLWEEDTTLTENEYGIPEPVDGVLVDVQLLDVVLIPLLAFDTQGNRLGYGKGFYDKFLSKCKPSCRFMGLSLFPPHPDNFQPDNWDIPVHLCVTPDKTYRFS